MYERLASSQPLAIYLFSIAAAFVPVLVLPFILPFWKA